MKLQDALDLHDAIVRHVPDDKEWAEHVKPIVEAARRVANLDYKAATKAGHDVYERLAPEYGYTTRQKSRVAWERLPQEHRDLMVAAYTVAINAALGITEDTEE